MGSTVPFTDIKGACDYAMAVYHQLGPTKGMKIQNVLGDLGLTTINDLTPDKFESFYKGVEALKNG